MTEREAYIAANIAPGIGAVTVGKAAARLGSVASLFELGPEELSVKAGIGRERAAVFSEALRSADYGGEMRRAAEMGVELITPADDEYPGRLRELTHYPLALYVAGSAAALSAAGVGVVGTRSPSVYGRGMARSICCGLAQSGLSVISGLARGIDTEAHKAALLSGGCTVAVVGSSLDRLYPEENRELARKIVRSGGAVISELPLGRSANRQTFPMRNRIIAGLSCGVLVVEAGNASGSLITADFALSQGRPVMAVPGRADCDTAHGVNRLIKDGARLVETAAEVVDEVLGAGLNIAHPAARGCSAAERPQAAERPAPHLDEFEVRIMECLGGGEKTADEIIAYTGIPAVKVNPRITALEMKCFVERLPGNILRARNGKGG